jgi:hypothetical protein
MTDHRRAKSLHTEHAFDETMSRMTEVITFRAPSGEGKATLEEIATAQGEDVSTFVRIAIAQRVQRIADEWTPTGIAAMRRFRIPPWTAASCAAKGVRVVLRT